LAQNASIAASRAASSLNSRGRPTVRDVAFCAIFNAILERTVLNIILIGQECKGEVGFVSEEELTDVQEPTAMRWWHGLEDDPRFMQTRARMRALVEQQRSNIRSLLALHDMEALVSPLVEPE